MTTAELPADSRALESPDAGGSSSRRRRRRRPSLARFERSTTVLLVTTVLVAVMAIGTVHVPVLVCVGLLAAATAILALLGGASVTAPALVLMGLALWSAMQAIPLPRGWTGWLSPANLSIWDGALAPLGEGGALLVPISLDPGASWVEALKHLAYAAVFVAAAATGARRSARFGATVLLGTALLVAVTTLAHGAIDAVQVYGFYEPRVGGARWRVSPLMNSNNLAGYSNLGLLAGASLLAAPRPPVPRLALGLMLAIVLAGSLLTGSRGGLAALACGVLVLVLLLRDLQRHGTGEVARSLRTVALAGLGTGLVGIAFVLAATGQRSVGLLLSGDSQKLQVASAAVPMVKEHLWLGIGRGAFESVFPAFRLGEGNVVYSHAESFPVQWIAEWGLPVGMGLLAGFAWFLRPARWGTREGVAACGLYAGVIALTLQNLVDLSFEVPGVAIAAVAAAGFAVGAAAGEGERPPRRQRRAWVLAIGVVGILLAALAALLGSQTVTLDRDSVQAASLRHREDPAERDAFWSTLRGAILRHPAEPYFPRSGAFAAWMSGTENPMPWLQRALTRSLTSARTHLLLAAILAQRGATHQALLELRLALEQAADLSPTAAKLAVKLTTDPSELARAVPDGERGGYMLLSLARVLPRDELPARLQLLRGALSRDKSLDAARVMLLEHLLSALEGATGSEACAGERRPVCEREALEEVERFAAQRPDAQAPVVLRGRLLRAQGRTSEAVDLLSRRCPALHPRTECLRDWLQSSLAARRHDQEQAAARAFELDGCSDDGRCASTLTTIGDLLRNAGEATRALGFYERAAREEPSPARWRRVAQAARALGDHVRAAHALEQGDRGRRDRATSREIDQERLRALKEEIEGREGPFTGTRTPPAASERAPASRTPTTRIPSRTSPRGTSPSVIDLAK